MDAWKVDGFVRDMVRFRFRVRVRVGKFTTDVLRFHDTRKIDGS